MSDDYTCSRDGVQHWKGTGQDMIGDRPGRNDSVVPTYADEKEILDSPLRHGDSSASSDNEEPTEEETRTLVRVADKLPWSAWLVAAIELCERFAYYGLSGPFQNYMQNAADDPKLPGAIGYSPCL